MSSLNKSTNICLPIKIIKYLFPLFFCLSLYLGCSIHKESIRAKSPSEAMEKLGWWGRPRFEDDLDFESLLAAIEKNSIYLNRLPPDRVVNYGNQKVTVGEIRDSFNHFVTILKESKSSSELNEKIIKDFDIFQSVANRDKVLFTGYYEPIIKGSPVESELYKYPIYTTPKDLLQIRLGDFRSSLKGERIIARINNGKLTPYYDRGEIDQEGVLKGQNLEMAWLEDPVDVFFLHIQGSGIISLEDGSMLSVNYLASNGREYRSIGRLLIEEEKVPKEKMSMKAIREYLVSHPSEMVRVLGYNKSYVFFRTVEKGPIGSTSVPLTAGRSIASDKRLFPKGGLAYIETEIPETDKNGNITGWKKISRFVIDQDTGGAIKGPARVDLFFGTGDEYGRNAGHMNRKGKLFYLIKKRG